MKVVYLIFIMIVSFLSLFLGFKILKKFNAESENLSKKELFFRGDTKQEIYGLIIIGVIGHWNIIIIYSRL